MYGYFHTDEKYCFFPFLLSIISQFSAAVPPFFDGEVCAILVDRTMIKEEETWE